MDSSKKSLTAPISLTGVRAMFSIATLSRGRAPLAVCLAVLLLGFAALEIRAQEEPTRLDELVVSDGEVQFGFFVSGRCIRINGSTIGGVYYFVHSSKWQRRSGAGSPWGDIPGTEETDALCAFSPESEGEYRLVADMTVGDERGFYKSNTLFDPEPGQVTGVRVAEGVEQLTVSWNEITDSGPGWNGAESYVVEWKSGSENYSFRRRHRVDGGSITSYTITGLTTGTAYTVRVSAKLASTTGGFPHDGKPSDEVTATPRAMTGTDPAPADQAAFDDLVVGQRLINEDDPDPFYYWEFVAAGRFEVGAGAETVTGSYSYANTGVNTGDLVFNPDDEESFTAHLVFTSTTTGTAAATDTDGESFQFNWRLIPIPDPLTTLYFPDYADGAGWSVQLAVSNINTTENAAVLVAAYDREGQEIGVFFAVEDPKDTFTLVDDFEIPPLGTLVLKSAGPHADPAREFRRGWIVVKTDTASVSGLLTYRNAETGVEVSVEPVELGNHFALFVEESSGIGTGLAIFKPDPSSKIEFRIYGEDGINPLGEEFVTHPVEGRTFQQATLSIPRWFDVDGIDTEFLKDFRGILLLRAEDDSLFAPIGIRFGKRGESLSAVPVIPVTSVPESPAQLAPADQAAFDDIAVGKRALSDFPNYYTDFISPGRFRETEGSDIWTGSYTYRNTGSDTGTVTFNYDDGDRCTTSLTFDSTTSGTSTYTCNDGTSGSSNWRLVEIPSG